MSYPEGTTRDEMLPSDALSECYDLWASGAWPESNAGPNLDEVMRHVERLLKNSALPAHAWRHMDGSICTDPTNNGPNQTFCNQHDRRVKYK